MASSLIYLPHVKLLYFKWLEPLGFPYTSFSPIPDCNAFFDCLLLGSFVAIAYLAYHAVKARRKEE